MKSAAFSFGYSTTRSLFFNMTSHSLPSFVSSSALSLSLSNHFCTSSSSSAFISDASPARRRLLCSPSSLQFSSPCIFPPSSYPHLRAVPFSTLSNARSRPVANARKKKVKPSSSTSAKNKHQLKRTQPTTQQKEQPLPENHPSNESLVVHLRNKAGQGAARKLVSTIQECENGQNQWGEAQIKPCDRAYAVAFRALTQARRGELVAELWRVRSGSSNNLPFNAGLTASALRCVVRDSKKRDERKDNLKYLFSVMRDEAERLIAESNHHDGERGTKTAVESDGDYSGTGSEREEEDAGEKEQGQDDEISDDQLAVLTNEEVEGISDTTESGEQYESAPLAFEIETQSEEAYDDNSSSNRAPFPNNDVSRMASALASVFNAFYARLHKGESVKGSDLDYAEEALGLLRSLSVVYGPTSALSVGEYNELLRVLGKVRDVDGLFEILDLMRLNGVPRDSLTFEHLANAVVRQVRFVTGAVNMSGLPLADMAEVAFVGRSNVGKSSLVNMLCNRKALAFVSGRPGKTQQFNYFIVNEVDADKYPEQRFYLVDLPGIGYAKVPQDLQAKWLVFMQDYLRFRTSLRLVFHLVDGRHGPLNDDHDLMRQIAVVRGAFVYVVVLTKMDKTAKQKAKKSVIDATRRALVENGCDEQTPIVLTSASSKLGRDDMWRHLRGAIAPVRKDRTRFRHHT